MEIVAAVVAALLVIALVATNAAWLYFSEQKDKRHYEEREVLMNRVQHVPLAPKDPPGPSGEMTYAPFDDDDAWAAHIREAS